jgi:DNA repair exonuclease SbcCD ATPase subunit
MKLERLTIRRLPGIDRDITVEPALDRPTVITGPNASGKTSLVRALRALIHPADAPDFVDLDARFVQDGRHWDGRALGRAREWRCDGELRNGSDGPDWPDPDQLDAFLVRADDLLDTGSTEAGIAEALRRLLAGGFDIEALLRSPVFSQPSKPRGLHQQHDKRLGELDKLERRQAALADDVDRLEQLQSQLASARRADDRRRAVERALEVLEQRQTLDTVRRRIAALGPGLDRLDGKEGERLAELEDQIAERARRERSQKSALDAARARLDELGFDDLDAADRARQGLADDLRRWQALDARRRELQQQFDRAEEARREAGRRIGARGPDTPPVPDLEAVDALDDAAARLDRAETERAQLKREQAAVADLDDPGPQIDTERNAVRALRDWQSSRPPAAGFWIVNGAVLVACLAVGLPWTGWIPPDYVLPLPVAWTGLRPVLLGAAAAPLGWMMAGAFRAQRSRAIRRRFEAQGLDGPAHWTRDAVSARCNALDRSIADQVLLRRQWERGLERTGAIEQAERACSEAWTAWERACLALGLDADETDRSAAHRYRLRELHDLQRADQRADDARAALTTLAEEQAGLNARVAERLATLKDEHPVPDHADALADRLRALEARITEGRDARSTLVNAQSRLEQLEADRTALDTRIERLFANAGLLEDPDEILRDPNDPFGGPGVDAPVQGPDHDPDRDPEHDLDPDATASSTQAPRAVLQQRLRLLPEWQSLDSERRRLEHAVGEGQQALESTPDLKSWVDQADLESLRNALNDATLSSNRLEELIREIERIELERKRALDERELEALNADRERLRDQLAEARDTRQFAAAGRFLLERAQAGHVARNQPELLKRAKTWFGRFTHAGWALEFDGQAFSARELATGERRSVQQLSTATRIQLLLALRLAWMDEIGRDRATPPIVLDEVLATSDPARYQAVVEAGAELVQAGRQLIYLSAQPADVEAWRRFHAEPEPRVIELAPTRGDASFRFTPEAPLVRPDPQRAPADWARAAGVSRLDPFAPAERVALFHLAPDRLADLNTLRARRVLTLGQFEQAEALDALPLDDEPVDIFEARIRAVRAWLPLWQRGHARPVTAETLHRSEAVTGTFINDVVDLNQELQGDGPALIDALRDSRVKGFRTAKIDDLEAFLDAAGCLTAEREVTDTERITTLARTGPLDDPAAERLDAWLRAGVASFE